MTDREQQWDRTVAIWKSKQWSDLDVSTFGKRSSLGIAMVVRRHRLFGVGDLVIVDFMNGGGERQWATGHSSKGYNVSQYYTKYAAYDDGGQHHGWTVHLIELPRDLDGKSPDDAAVRRFAVETMRAWDAASRVGASSPAPFREAKPTKTERARGGSRYKKTAVLSWKAHRLSRAVGDLVGCLHDVKEGKLTRERLAEILGRPEVKRALGIKVSARESRDW